jgi:cell division septal protein FtsQ
MSIVLSLGVYLALNQSSVFAIRAIPLEWNGRLDRGRMELEIGREIEASIGVRFSNVMGKRPWEVDLEMLGRSIRSLPWVSDARVQRVFPDRITVSIIPKRPLAVIVTGKTKGSFNSSLRPVSYDGELMAEWKSNTVPDVPFLRGEAFVTDPALRARAVELIRALPDEGVLSRSNIAEISWAPGFSLLLLSPRTEIKLGETEIETKIIRVAHVLNYLSTQGKKAPIIDSTSVKKVVVRAHHRP